jgi:FHS family L-fucose permease-like MFS transporter
MQERQSAGVTGAYAIVTCLFFAWGFITSLVDPLVAAADRDRMDPDDVGE